MSGGVCSAEGMQNKLGAVFKMNPRGRAGEESCTRTCTQSVVAVNVARRRSVMSNDTGACARIILQAAAAAAEERGFRLGTFRKRLQAFPAQALLFCTA